MTEPTNADESPPATHGQTDNDDTCWCDDRDFPCWECFRSDRHDLDGNYIATDGGTRNGEPVADLCELREGDRVTWGDRTLPLTVVRTTFGSHVIAEGLDGTIYRIQPDPRSGGFRFGDRGGTVEDFRRIERADDEAGGEGDNGG